jgi:hypothetical protein
LHRARGRLRDRATACAGPGMRALEGIVLRALLPARAASQPSRIEVFPTARYALATAWIRSLGPPSASRNVRPHRLGPSSTTLRHYGAQHGKPGSTAAVKCGAVARRSNRMLLSILTGSMLSIFRLRRTT